MNTCASIFQLFALFIYLDTKFQVCNVMILYVYMLWNDHKSS